MTPPTTPPLDFAQIRQQYPAAFAALDKWAETLPDNQRTVEWIGEERATSSSLEAFSVPTNPRDLFDFFDQQGVYVIIYKPGRRWLYKFDGCPDVRWGWDTRAAAEAAAFRAAFDKLEGILAGS